MITSRFHSTIHNPGANDAVAEFVSRVIWGDNRGFAPWCSMAVLDGPDLIAGVIYHSVNEDTGVIELSGGAVSPRWAKPHVLRMMFDIPFDLLGVQMCLHRVSADNPGVVSQMRRLGHREYLIPRMAGRNTDGHVFTLTDTDWAKHPLKLRGVRANLPGQR